ncbi:MULTISPECIES: flagellar basal body rod protein FlgC [Sporomusa]|uniref:Flagellar basal-body rod protein FlgC n=2 Tax=Sporomusa TaxID=2375 RepID=A0ABP2C1G2_9FIRM|nr:MULTISPECIES: flagellar basal body rod protein FlgC [Sporomusa]MCM0760200.1 flagellar basal body rod protein FlgC [Sporomusa sphaeroides DSM 2875]OLS58151.1 flagellar basal-body rod protein FlgC [Sporomusa sphaeroides DSM 2875]CVK17662.1 Flagellar basal-body rod protein FlgC [Sporomusa sphaeroides DSM 2875]SCM80469.1 Flagellar basal-body rod protein FlgC [uncultured Sporomusa sp.]
MGLFRAIDSAASGMTAERLRMDVISNNIANVNTTRTAEGGPYRRQMVVFEPRSEQASFGQLLSRQMESGEGVRVTGIIKDNAPLKLMYDPNHPDANQDGYVEMPNINIVSEMVDMITATRAYEANVAAVNAAKSMALKALDIGK